MDFQNYIPLRASPYIAKWISELDIDIRFVNARKTKLGDYRFRNNQHFITVNNNLNKYASLITLTHEIAHAFTFAEFGKNIKPHAMQWKENFKKLMLNFFDYNIFPDDILPALSRYLINPSASTTNDEFLSLILRKYDSEIFLTISEINDGDNFTYSGEKYMKCQKMRKRIKCLNLTNNRYYLFNPIAKIEIN
ncbi:SprT-like domain-containing protein [Flavobacteriales bacterium]|nr:SprT-like domain-containing protein [Flavobacteriales bacterium]